MDGKKIKQLEKKIKQVSKQISLNPEQFPKSETYKNLHKAIVDKNNYLVYRVNHSKTNYRIYEF